jgi:hypothetical protein
MDDESLNNSFIDTDICVEFHCDSTGQPFQFCIECESELIESNKHYFIEKAVRKYPDSDKTLTIFEFAICQECIYTRQQELSEDSEEALANFYAGKTITKPPFLHKGFESLYISSSLETCAFSGKPLEDSQEYQIVGEFNGKQMRLSNFPFAISGEQIEAISEILSEETKGGFDDFIGKHFSGPPEFQELWEKPKVILV